MVVTFDLSSLLSHPLAFLSFSLPLCSRPLSLSVSLSPTPSLSLPQAVVRGFVRCVSCSVTFKEP